MCSMVSRALARRARGERGFTLLELLVVVIIIGILAAVSIPIYMNQRKKAWDSAALSDVKNAMTATELATVDTNGSFAFLSGGTCTGGKEGDRAYITAAGSGEQTEFLCSAGVIVTVNFDPYGNHYTVTGHHESGSKEYKFDSATGNIEASDFKGK